jgi:hypothetical protein
MAVTQHSYIWKIANFSAFMVCCGLQLGDWARFMLHRATDLDIFFGMTEYSSPNIIGVIESRRMKWVGHVACIVDMRNAYIILIRKLEDEVC